MGESMIRVYSEIACLLDCFPESYIQRIPIKLLEQIRKNFLPEYKIKVNINENIDKQCISKETKNMLVVLKYNYWSTEEEQKQIAQKLKENEKKYLDEQRRKYNPDNIFEHKNNPVENTAIIEYKEDSFIKKLLNKIISLLRGRRE